MQKLLGHVIERLRSTDPMCDTPSVISSLWNVIPHLSEQELVTINNILREYNWPVWIIPMYVCKCLFDAADKIKYVELVKALPGRQKTYLHLVHTNTVFPGAVTYQQLVQLISESAMTARDVPFFSGAGVLVPAFENDDEEFVVTPTCDKHVQNNAVWCIHFTLLPPLSSSARQQQQK